MNPTRQRDLGTPASPATDKVRIEIDGLPATVDAGSSIMRACRESGVDIPKLCATDSVKPFGSCRLCLVEIEGRQGYPASCTTPVEAGMRIRTQTEKLSQLRRNVMELYISDHPLDCLTCSANGDCELQDMAGAVGLREVRYGFDGKNHLDAPVDASNPYFQFDASKCIVCSRCVRACDEVQGTFALTIEGRGFDSKVSAGISENFLDSECVSCGACVQACPTATLMEKSIVDHGQPDHKVITTCAYCGVGCSFQAEMKGDQVVRMTPWKDGEANHGHSCVKGRFAWGYASHRDRVLKPMIRDNTTDPWREVEWDEAIRYTAKRFREIQDEHGRKSIGGITSSRCTNEEVYVVQKLVRTAMGNNNVDTCARVCHSPTGYGLCVTDEAAPAPGCATHRRRPARDRPRAFAPHRGRAPPEPAAWHQRSHHQRTCARHRPGRSRRRGVRQGALRPRLLGVVEGYDPQTGKLPRGGRQGLRCRRRKDSRGCAPLWQCA
jgi:formate dehydrogenase major subunit